MPIQQLQQWIVGPLGSTIARLHLSKALGPTQNKAPAARWLSPNLARIRRTVAGDGTPSNYSFKTRRASSTAENGP